MAKLAYAPDLGSGGVIRAGSTPVTRTIFRRQNGNNNHLTLVKSIPIIGVLFFYAFPSFIFARFLIVISR